MNSTGDCGEAWNAGGSAIGEEPPTPLDMPPNPADSDRADDSETIAEDPASVDVRALLGAPGVPAPLHDPMPKDEDGRPDWARLAAVIAAVDSLLEAGMVGHARSVLAEARAIAEAAIGPLAAVIQIGVERARR